MTARILVVDDIPTNVKLLEARLMAEYFQVLTATNGSDALQICESGLCDVVLLDVMMPGMDGFEVCQRLKSNPATMHLPVVMVTALDNPEDKRRGLEVGADDFLTKPVNDLALVTRVKSLARLKMLTDDLRLRAANGDELAIDGFGSEGSATLEHTRANLVVVDDDPVSYGRVLDILSENNAVDVVTDPQEALIEVAEGTYDLAVISLNLQDFDSLRLCSYLRSLERTRSMPMLVVAEAVQDELISRAMEIGVNDYIRRPIEKHELIARINTQMLRKRYHDCLRNSVQQTIEMAVKDPLTGLHNRRYFDSHGNALFEKASTSGSQLSAIMCDIDHFKAVNDTHGHHVGDAVLRECAKRLSKNVRDIDLACRYGGEEFVILMPDTGLELGQLVAERIREEVASHPVVTNDGATRVEITLSLGVSAIQEEGDCLEALLKRADSALYNAKRDGRNMVVTLAA